MNDRVAPGGDPPHDPAMEARMAALETDVREIKGILQRLEPLLGRMDARIEQLDERLRKVEIDVAELKGRVSQLPTTLTLFGFVLAVLAAGGLMRHFFP